MLEYVPGPTLRELLEVGPMRPDEVARIGADLARTLAYVHDNDVIHRDVKPSNVLITGDGWPVLNDFGVSYRQGRTRWTATGFVNGTAAYLAPEQVRGDPPGPGIDVYALGLVLMECLSGRPEYDGSAIEAAVARLHRDPQRPIGVPDWLAEALVAMTVSDPAQRPTAAEAADLLSEARLAIMAEPAPRPASRAWARVALLAGATTAAAAGLVAALVLPGDVPVGTAGQPAVPALGPPVIDESPVAATQGSTGSASSSFSTGNHSTGRSTGAASALVANQRATSAASKSGPQAAATGPQAAAGPAPAAGPAAPEDKAKPDPSKAKGKGKGGGKGKG